MISSSFTKPLLVSALALLVGAVPFTKVAAESLPVGKLSQIEGDVTCASTFRTGETLAYAETASYRIYICSDRSNPTQPRYYRSFNKQGSGSLTLAAENYNPQKPDAYEFDNQGYLYRVELPWIRSKPVLRVTLPNGKRYEERIVRFLRAEAASQPSQPSQPSNTRPTQQEILSYFDRNRDRFGVCKDSTQAEAAQYSKVIPVDDRRFLVQFRCFMGAYQGGYEFYLYAAAPAQVQPLSLRRYQENANGQFAWTQERLVVGLPKFDSQQQQLSVFTKSRGLGDCGALARYKLQGNELKLQEYRVKQACDGRYVEPEQYPRVFP